MSDVVIDANLAVKWVIQQDHSDRAQKLFEDAITSHGRLVSPPLFRSEVVNAIYQHRRSQDPRWHISDEEAEAAVERFLTLPVLLMAPDGLYQRAFRFARDHGLPNTYDSIYVVLAQMLGVEMWTDDQVLLRSVGAAASWVRSIRDYAL